jgi:hypothetical protein
MFNLAFAAHEAEAQSSPPLTGLAKLVKEKLAHAEAEEAPSLSELGALLQARLEGLVIRGVTTIDSTPLYIVSIDDDEE